MRRPFSQVDVFSGEAFRGNPVAVVHDADGLSDAQMAAFARWTDLSETTFLLAPTTPEADYRLRIFTPGGELPFAGHPTLGSARAWLAAGGEPARAGRLVQECGIGLVPLRRIGEPGEGERLAFAAPGLLRSGDLDAATQDQALRSLGLSAQACRGAAWIDNGPGWLGMLLDSAQTVLDLRPDFGVMGDLKVGVIGPYEGAGPAEAPADFEVRAFVPTLGVPEDPVTGSLNAGFAVWLIAAGLAPAHYTVSQGTVLQRAGRLSIERDDDGDDDGDGAGMIWVGGQAVVRITGTLDTDEPSG